MELVFEDVAAARTTILRLGGLALATLPVLDPANANDGQMYSMGIGNHPFYENIRGSSPPQRQ
ncbi:MAG: hypothetical protein IPH12_02180 [Saprospirales bacterium]|nr:hypothetical protein [Saprospirales bacterium]